MFFYPAEKGLFREAFLLVEVIEIVEAMDMDTMVLDQEKMLATQELHDLYPLEITRGLEYEPGNQELPWAASASMQVKDGAMHIAEAHGSNIITYTKPLGQEDAATEMLNWLRQAAQQRYLQWIAAGLREEDQPQNVFSRLCLEEDIVPFVIRKQDGVHGQNLRSEEHTSELQSPDHLVCRLLLEKKK